MFVTLLRLFIAVLWSPTRKGDDLLALVCIFVTFQCGILGQVWYLIVWILDLCRLLYQFKHVPKSPYGDLGELS